MQLLPRLLLQVQQKLTDLQEEERSVTAQLSWKRALEDSSPVMVNGTAGPSVELHQGDLFQQDPFQDDQPKELREDKEAAAAFVCVEPKERPHQKEKEDDERQEDEEEEEEEEENVHEGSKTAEEQKPKPDALDDLFTSLASSDMYNSVSAFGKPQETVDKVGNTVKHLLHSSTSPHSTACSWSRSAARAAFQNSV